MQSSSHWLGLPTCFCCGLYCEPLKFVLVITLLGYVLIPDCAATKIISDRASLQTQERLWRRDFVDGATLRHADLESGASHIGYVLCHTLAQCENLKIGRSEAWKGSKYLRLRTGIWCTKSLSAKRAGSIIDVCERLVSRPEPLLFILTG